MSVRDTMKEILTPVLKEAGVVRAAFFGSVARGEEGKESDIDILVELPEGGSLLDLVDLKFKLEEVAGRPVDIITFQSIHPPLRNIIEREQVPIF